jgi:hypothetical protein
MSKEPGDAALQQGSARRTSSVEEGPSVGGVYSHVPPDPRVALVQTLLELALGPDGATSHQV